MTVIRLGDYSVRLRPRPAAAAAGVLAALAAVAVWTATTGTFELSLDRLGPALAGSGTAAEDFIVWQVRLPRLATGLAVGACLGLAGAVFQTLTRNPLGSPDFLGLTHGASTGALLAIITTTGATTGFVAGSAACGAIVTGAVIYLLTRGGDRSGYRLVLVGIGVSAIAVGVNGFLLTRSDIVDAARAVFWITGDLSGRDWNQAGTVAAVLALGAAVAVFIGRGLEAMLLGEDSAVGLGVNVTAVRTIALITAAVLTGGGVAVSGPLAFVALAAPHIAARLTGATRSFLCAALVGALIVTAADAIAVAGVGERQLPTGVVTGVVGGLYLMWLLVTHRKKGVMS
ncbi:FecCD family ABC transporter permease [Glycomyces xiaoerkulensis]|uniref:FecCD family ABC transporter permease n=1 Tax=Glycomyces xiaoerkulensis TaxID=2038139 RepID=UPI000C25E0D7|nr:iron chelate uptake ABC transporter family permease subunit [Glycomyces xiaoerkulensis]